MRKALTCPKCGTTLHEIHKFYQYRDGKLGKQSACGVSRKGLTTAQVTTAWCFTTCEECLKKRKEEGT